MKYLGAEIFLLTSHSKAVKGEVIILCSKTANWS
jgi:hypothetical protein